MLVRSTMSKKTQCPVGLPKARRTITNHNLGPLDRLAAGAGLGAGTVRNLYDAAERASPPPPSPPLSMLCPREQVPFVGPRSWIFSGSSRCPLDVTPEVPPEMLPQRFPQSGGRPAAQKSAARTMRLNERRPGSPPPDTRRFDKVPVFYTNC